LTPQPTAPAKEELDNQSGKDEIDSLKHEDNKIYGELTKHLGRIMTLEKQFKVNQPINEDRLNVHADQIGELMESVKRLEGKKKKSKKIVFGCWVELLEDYSTFGKGQKAIVLEFDDDMVRVENMGNYNWIPLILLKRTKAQVK